MDAGVLTDRIGPLPAWGWMAGGGAILAVVFIAKGSGGGATTPATVYTGSGGLSSADVAAAVAAQSAQDQSYLADMLKAAQDAAQAQIDGLTAADSAALAAQAAQGAADKSALQQAIDALKAQIAGLIAAAKPIVSPIVSPVVPIGATSDGRIHGQGSFLEGLYSWQVRDPFTGSTWDAAKTWRDLPTYGWPDAKGALVKGTQGAFGFLWPTNYDPAKDTARLDGLAQGPETSWTRTWRRFNDYMQAHPNADPAEVFRLEIGRTAGDAQAQGKLGGVGFDLTGIKVYNDANTLRADEQLLAQGFHIGAP